MKSGVVYNVWLKSSENTSWNIKLFHPVTQTCVSVSAAPDEMCAK